MSEVLDITEIQRQNELHHLKMLGLDLVQGASARSGRIDRSRIVKIDGRDVEISQSVPVYTGGTPLHRPIHDMPTDTAALLEPNSWDKYMGGGDLDHSSLIIRPDVWINNFKGSWFIPAIDDAVSQSSNVRLLDPFENKVIEATDPEYHAKWARIVAWALEKLDEDSDIYATEHVGFWPMLEATAAVALGQQIGLTVLEVSKVEVLRTSDKRERKLLAGNAGFLKTLVFFEGEEEGQKGHADLYIVGDEVKLRDHRSGDLFRGKQPKLTNPYNTDPELVKKVLFLQADWAERAIPKTRFTPSNSATGHIQKARSLALTSLDLAPFKRDQTTNVSLGHMSTSIGENKARKQRHYMST